MTNEPISQNRMVTQLKMAHFELDFNTNENLIHVQLVVDERLRKVIPA